MQGLADQLVVLAMCADPEPMNTVGHRGSECSVVQADSDAVVAPIADRLEVQRRMRRIRPELCVATVGECLNIGRQRLQALPEAL